MPTTNRTSGPLVSGRSNLSAPRTLFGAAVSRPVYRHRIERRFYHPRLWVDRRGGIVVGGGYG